MPPGVTLPKFPGTPDIGTLPRENGLRSQRPRDAFSAVPTAARARGLPSDIEAKPLRPIDFPMPKIAPAPVAGPSAKEYDPSQDILGLLGLNGPPKGGFDPIGGFQAGGRLFQNLIAPGSVTEFPGSEEAPTEFTGAASATPVIQRGQPATLTLANGEQRQFAESEFRQVVAAGALGEALAFFDRGVTGLDDEVLGGVTFAHMPYFENLGTAALYLDGGQIKGMTRRFEGLQENGTDEDFRQFWSEAATLADLARQQFVGNKARERGIEYGEQAIENFSQWDERAAESLASDPLYQQLLTRSREDALGPEFVDSIVQAARPALDNMVGQDAANYQTAMDAGGQIAINGLAGQLAHQSRIAGVAAEVRLRGEAETSRQDFNERSRQFYTGQATQFSGQRHAQFFSAAASQLSFDQLMAGMKGTAFAAASGLDTLLPFQIGFDMSAEELDRLETENNPLYMFLTGFTDIAGQSLAQAGAGIIPEIGQNLLGG